MKRKVKSIQRMANQLTDPKPEFVSHVKHGANQDPFRVLKSEDEMPNQAEIQKIRFSSSKFDSAEKVEEYLEAKGYTDFTVEKTKKGFEVQAKDEGEFSSELKEIQGDEGVIFVVGKLAEGKSKLKEKKETKAAKVEKVLKDAAGIDADEVVKKYCDYCCHTYTPPSGKTVADVLTEQYSNGSFPGLWDLHSAFQTALMNLIKEGDTGKIKALTAEFGELIASILTALASAGVDTTAVKAHFEKQPEKENGTMTVEKKDAPAGAAEAKDEKATKADAPAGEDKAPEQKTEGEPAPAEKAADKADEPAEKNSGEKAEKADAPDMVAVMAKAIGDAMSPLTAAVKELADGQKAMKDSLADLESKVSKTGERVSELEGARQTRKSADDNGLPSSTQGDAPASEETKAQKAYDERMQRNRMGFMT